MSTHNMPLLDKYPGIVYRCANGHLHEVTGDFNRMAPADDAENQEQPNDADNDADLRQELPTT